MNYVALEAGFANDKFMSLHLQSRHTCYHCDLMCCKHSYLWINIKTMKLILLFLHKAKNMLYLNFIRTTIWYFLLLYITSHHHHQKHITPTYPLGQASHLAKFQFLLNTCTGFVPFFRNKFPGLFQVSVWLFKGTKVHINLNNPKISMLILLTAFHTLQFF